MKLVKKQKINSNSNNNNYSPKKLKNNTKNATKKPSVHNVTEY